MKNKRIICQLALLFGAVFILGCASNPYKNIVEGVYNSPNGGFAYEMSAEIPEDLKVTENILPQGGNVQFFQWSHFKRIDYVNFSPTVEKEIQDISFHKALVKNFAMGIFVPAISQDVPGAKVVRSMFEDRNGVPVFYVSMLLPQASTKSLNGKRLDACRCMLAHVTATAGYVFTVSGGIDDRRITDKQEAFDQTEERLKKKLSAFFNDVKLDRYQSQSANGAR